MARRTVYDRKMRDAAQTMAANAKVMVTTRDADSALQIPPYSCDLDRTTQPCLCRNCRADWTPCHLAQAPTGIAGSAEWKLSASG